MCRFSPLIILYPMPYIRLPNFKLGIKPSMRSVFNMEKLTGTQKLQLVQARIFGNSIGGNMRNGMKPLKRVDDSQNRLDQYSVPVWNPQQWFPFLEDVDTREWRRELQEGRKMRILMRGVKIGRQKGGEKVSILNIYERKKASIDGEAK